LAIGCKSASTEEIKATTEALKSIQNDDVVTYAPQSLKAAEDALSTALAEVQTQDQIHLAERLQKVDRFAEVGQGLEPESRE
jgi:hypothetical protein